MNAGGRTVHDAKWEFVHSQILASSVMASLRRANVYAAAVTSAEREHLRKELTVALRDIGSRYTNTVPGLQHEQHIVELVERISPRHPLWPTDASASASLRKPSISTSSTSGASDGSQPLRTARSTAA